MNAKTARRLGFGLVMVLAGQSFAGVVAYYDFETAGYANQFYSIPDVSGNSLDLAPGYYAKKMIRNSDTASFVNAGSTSGSGVDGGSHYRNDYYKGDSAFNVGVDQGLTVEGFLKIDSGSVYTAETGTTHNITRMVPLAVYDNAGQTTWNLVLGRATGGSDWQLSFEFAGGSVASGGYDIPMDQWFYYAAVRDAGTDELRLYLDSGTGLQLKNTTSISAAADVTAQTLRMNYQYYANYYDAYHGYQDNTRISNEALSTDAFLIPEPASLGLIGLAAGGLLFVRRMMRI